jgi:hypothetical protein
MYLARTVQYAGQPQNYPTVDLRGTVRANWGYRRFAEALPSVYADQMRLHRSLWPNDEVVEMALCEIAWLILRPGQLYRFIAYPGCADCEAYLDALANIDDLDDADSGRGVDNDAVQRDNGGRRLTED